MDNRSYIESSLKELAILSISLTTKNECISNQLNKLKNLINQFENVRGKLNLSLKDNFNAIDAEHIIESKAFNLINNANNYKFEQNTNYKASYKSAQLKQNIFESNFGNEDSVCMPLFNLARVRASILGVNDVIANIETLKNLLDGKTYNMVNVITAFLLNAVMDSSIITKFGRTFVDADYNENKISFDNKGRFIAPEYEIKTITKRIRDNSTHQLEEEEVEEKVQTGKIIVF